MENKQTNKQKLSKTDRKKRTTNVRKKERIKKGMRKEQEISEESGGDIIRVGCRCHIYNFSFVAKKERKGSPSQKMCSLYCYSKKAFLLTLSLLSSIKALRRYVPPPPTLTPPPPYLSLFTSKSEKHFVFKSCLQISFKRYHNQHEDWQCTHCIWQNIPSTGDDDEVILM